MTGPSGAVCPHHPESAALEHRHRCGGFLCKDCVRRNGEHGYCLPCLGRLGPATGKPGRVFSVAVACSSRLTPTAKPSTVAE